MNRLSPSQPIIHQYQKIFYCHKNKVLLRHTALYRLNYTLRCRKCSLGPSRPHVLGPHYFAGRNLNIIMRQDEIYLNPLFIYFCCH